MTKALFYLFCFSLMSIARADLPAMHADPRLITASGISSGAMMASQLLVAASDIFLGAGSVAGGPYGCAQGNVDTAKGLCMKNADQIQIAPLLAVAKKLESSGQIPPLTNLKNKRMFVLNGSQDHVVNPVSGKKIVEWAQQFLLPQNIATEFSVPSGHGFPTVNVGNACQQESLPWMNKCGYDTAGAILSSLYHQSLRRATAKPGSLIKFSQAPYNRTNSMLTPEGYVYIPEDCKKAQIKCGIHVALHGCLQNPMMVQDNFVAKAGYNDWAEANGLIVLYPSVTQGNGNPMGCWDWWGYSGPDYLTRKAPQIDAILAMVQQLLKP